MIDYSSVLQSTGDSLENLSPACYYAVNGRPSKGAYGARDDLFRSDPSVYPSGVSIEQEQEPKQLLKP